MKEPCTFDHNGECLICDCWASDCAFQRFLNQDYSYETKEELEEMFENKNTLYKVGDKLEANDFDKENYGITSVTITSINLENQVYHWTAKMGQLGTMVSGYFFHEAKPYKEDDIKKD